ncbi:hypothetical protein HU230_0008145 [Bradyrhizobium quebecense]|uniref:Uncharacterized protein n=1 Tax=Bradyrhizobium quebecense TaxID=2748629 RepID=A0A974ABI6_9BRAD|nr:hypothetical protein [Bradyrhizobium quebecense]UGA45997.1 hypothetical protein HU230_0008145 [Bradyrhizobium quebecense]
MAVVLTTAIPITVSKEGLELKDWLGFAGNVLAAFVALIAAIIAWYAVQDQIAAQRDATLLGVMMREEDRLEGDFQACGVGVEFLRSIYSAELVPGGENVQGYCRQLRNQFGLNGDVTAMTSILREKLGTPASPNILYLMATHCAALMRGAERAEEATRKIDLLASDPDGRALFVREWNKIPPIREATSVVIDIVRKRQDEAAERLDALRRRIDAVLAIPD